MPSDEASARNEKFIQMTTAPVEKLVLGLAAPSIAIMLISALYNMADTYFVSSLGTSEVGAVGVAFPMMTVIQAMGFFFGQGSGNYMARALGAQNTDDASHMAATGLVSGFLVMAVIALPALSGWGRWSRGLAQRRPSARLRRNIFFSSFSPLPGWWRLWS